MTKRSLADNFKRSNQVATVVTVEPDRIDFTAWFLKGLFIEISSIWFDQPKSQSAAYACYTDHLLEQCGDQMSSLRLLTKPSVRLWERSPIGSSRYGGGKVSASVLIIVLTAKVAFLLGGCVFPSLPSNKRRKFLVPREKILWHDWPLDWRGNIYDPKKKIHAINWLLWHRRKSID